MAYTGPDALRVPAKATSQKPAPWGSSGNKLESKETPSGGQGPDAWGCEWESQGRRGSVGAFSRALWGPVRRTSRASRAGVQRRKVRAWRWGEVRERKERSRVFFPGAARGFCVSLNEWANQVLMDLPLNGLMGRPRFCSGPWALGCGCREGHLCE